MNFRLVITALAGALLAPATHAFDVDRPDVREFIDSMVSSHDYDEPTLLAILADAESSESILKAISRPAEKTLEWHEYRAIFLTDERVDAGAKF